MLIWVSLCVHYYSSKHSYNKFSQIIVNLTMITRVLTVLRPNTIKTTSAIESVLTPCALYVQGQTSDECIKRDVFTRITPGKKVSRLEMAV